MRRNSSGDRRLNSDAPIAVLGYASALERMVLFSTEAVAESIAFMAALPPEDRATIARATYETISLQCAAPSDYPGDAAMRALLDEFGWVMDEAGLA